MAGLLRKIKEIPGQALFQYYDDQKDIRQLESGDINEYLKMHMGKDFTCKDFRTWAGTVLALNYMQEEGLLPSEGPETTGKVHAPGIVEILDRVAAELGNTRAVTKQYYVHPELLKRYEMHELKTWIPQLLHCRSNALYKTGEKELLQFLKRLQKEK